MIADDFDWGKPLSQDQLSERILAKVVASIPVRHGMRQY